MYNDEGFFLLLSSTASLSSLLENNLQFNYYRESRGLLNGRNKSAMLLEHEIKYIEYKAEALYYV